MSQTALDLNCYMEDGSIKNTLIHLSIPEGGR